MNKSFVILILLSFYFANPSFSQTENTASDYLKDESAPGARASMGIFASGYGKAVSSKLFGFHRDSWKNRLSSVAIAGLGYQVVSFDKDSGLEFKPLKFNKEWKGYWAGYLAGEGLDLFLGIVREYSGAKFIVSSSVMISMSIIIAIGEEDNGWRTAKDGPLNFRNLFTNRHSYWSHFAGSGGLYWALSHHTATPEQALFYTSSVVWLWEVKDGYLRWEEYGFIGGDGFSWRDGVAGSIATAGSYIFDKWILPRIKSQLFAKHELRFKPSVSVLPLLYKKQWLLNLRISTAVF